MIQVRVERDEEIELERWSTSQQLPELRGIKRVDAEGFCVPG